MSALTKSRMTKQRRLTYDLRPLAAGAKVFKGGLAMCITAGGNAGYFEEANTTDTGVIVGKWAEDVDNTAGSNGTLSANVEYFRERFVEGLDNDTGTAVTNAMKEGPAYLLDDHTVTAAADATPVGVVYEVSADGKTVWVEGKASPIQTETVPVIQSGTSTLATGTKTVTGVAITATSRIFVTCKDPGAGAVTGVGLLDVPASGRTTGASGSFIVNMVDDSKAVITTAVATFDWLVIG